MKVLLQVLLVVFASVLFFGLKVDLVNAQQCGGYVNVDLGYCEDLGENGEHDCRFHRTVTDWHTTCDANTCKSQERVCSSNDCYPRYATQTTPDLVFLSCGPTTDFDSSCSQVNCGAGGGNCGGTRGACSGSCGSGFVCRAPSVLANGDACTCHPTGDTGIVNCYRPACVNEDTTPPINHCTGNNDGPVTDPPGYCDEEFNGDGCKDGQVCCRQRTSCTPSDPATPSLTSPPDDASLSTTLVTLDWAQLDTGSWGKSCDGNSCTQNNVNQYKLYLTTDQYGFGNPDSFVDTFDSNTTSTLFNGVSGTTYYWRIDASNGHGATSSSTWRFTINAAPPLQPPTDLQGSCLSAGTTATVSWNAAQGATYYALRVDDTPNSWEPGVSCDSAFTNTGLNNDVCLNLTATSYSFPTIPGHTFRWWVHSRNNMGEWQTISGVSGTNFSCPAPTCTSAGPSGNPKISSTLTSYEVSAIGVTDASSVDFWVWSDVPSSNPHDDLTQYPGTNQGGGVWKATINPALNPFFGQFRVDAWMNGWTRLCGWAPFYRNSPPAFGSLVLKNDLGNTVAAETGSRNQICQTNFNDSRTVQATITATDVDGAADITNIQLRWNGINFTRTSLVNGVANFSHNFLVGENSTGIHNFEVNVTDLAGETTGWVNTGRAFKVWDCTVPLTGNMYDSSDQPLGAVCSTGDGFTKLAGIEMGFKSVNITQIPGSQTVVNATGVDAYSASNLLKWSKTYNMAPNSDLAASGVKTRWVGTGGSIIGCGPQYALDSTMVDPYQASQSIKVDFSAIVNQDPWFSTKGGGIQASGSISNMVPLTCAVSGTCVPAMATELTTGEANNGVVMAPILNNNSGCAMDGSECSYGKPNNWYKTGNPLSSADKFSYQYFYDKYFGALGLGVTTAGNLTMTDVNNIGGTGVILVNGDFNVNVDNTLPVGNFLMIVAKGKITFDQSVGNSAGIFVADGGVVTTGSSNTQLVIEGTLYSSSTIGDIKLSREFSTQSDNNTSPVVVVKYRPDLLFKIPSIFKQNLKI